MSKKLEVTVGQKCLMRSGYRGGFTEYKVVKITPTGLIDAHPIHRDPESSTTRFRADGTKSGGTSWSHTMRLIPDTDPEYQATLDEAKLESLTYESITLAEQLAGRIRSRKPKTETLEKLKLAIEGLLKDLN